MKKRFKVGLLLLSLAAALLLVGFASVRQSRSLLGARLADQEQVAALAAEGDFSAEACALYWNGARLPFDQERNAYCLPQTLDGAAVGTLSAQWGTVYLPDWLWQTGWQNAMENSALLPVYVSDGKTWTRAYVYLSGLPVIAIDSQVRVSTPRDRDVVGWTMGRLPVENNYGSVRVFWPAGNVRQQTVSTGLEWHWRGNASYFAAKKSYRLNLMDTQGQADAQDLLGLGEDANWILLNLATDITRVRDKVANDLWNQMSAAYPHDPQGTRSEFVELYLNDRYMGVYLLTTRVDEDELQLTGQDRLYKYRQAVMIQDTDFDWVNQTQSLEWLNKLEVAWPKTWTDGVWDPMQDYVSLFYREESSPDWDEIETFANVENLIDVALYKQFTCAVDNAFQNQYMLYRQAEDRFYRIPWDMNYSWGDTHDGFLDRDLTTMVLPDMELETLYQADPERTKELVAARWDELRQTLFDVDTIQQAMLDQTRILTGSGALGRDLALWGKTGAYEGGLSLHLALDLDQTLEFVEERTEFLDEYMADYRPPEGG